MTSPARRDDAPTTNISHRGRRPERAALLLAGELGLRAALVVVNRELHLARKARSRLRFQFWAQVRDTLDGQPYAARLSDDRTPTTAAL